MEKLCKVLEMELKTYNLLGLKFVFEKIKFKVLHYIQHHFICPGLSISSSNTFTHCNGYIKDDKYFVFPGLNYVQSRVETIQKDHIYHIMQYQTFFRKIKCDLLSFRGLKNRYRRIFSI